MALYHTQQARAQQNLALQARLIAQSAMLQRTGDEFEATLAAEARENPAIEIEERTRCPHCGRPLRLGFCADCDILERSTADSWAWRSHGAATSEISALAGVPAHESLAASVLRQLRASLPAEDAAIAAYLTGSLDERGFLTATAADVAAALHVDEARVARAIDTLQTLDPPGVGARDITECLLRQLDACGECPAPNVTRALIENYLPDLAERRFERIARALRVSVATIQAGWAFIRQNLTPYPAGLADASAQPDRGAISIWPDVVFRSAPPGFTAEIIERRRWRLALDPLYVALKARSEAAALESRHVQTYAARAEEFLSLVRRRWETLALVAAALADEQRDFLARGVSGLRPLTRLDLARRLGVSESTVSRATSGKYALLPTGRIVAFDVFFDASLPAKQRLLALIEAEDHAHPLHDHDLARLLAAQGLHLAPRTVAKYREALGVAAPRLRVRSY